MALLYHRATVTVDHKDVLIRPIDDGDYSVAITFPDEEDENAITEVLLTANEVRELHDALFNR